MAKESKQEAKSRGRPRSESAAAHEGIMDAVYAILQEKSVRDLTMEEVARRAGVGKPTLYKWWPSKAALVMDMFEQRVVGRLAVSDTGTAEQAIRTQVRELIRLFNGFFGKVAAEIIAEGQSDPTILAEYCQRYMFKRRAFSAGVLEHARVRGELKRPIDPELFIDMIYGPIYFRLLVRHLPLDEAFGDALVDNLLAYAKG
ncbi:TetR/AcrR family transcriptional regulator [Singulisphaera sp. PoT]|uniref:TetR/AcrR family transcriptional regulator n=1 Tax=Singulisphaera sp. PoT TaxID=3411797 RepID=UPI003BF4FD43